MKPSNANLPKHVAFIMDGNRRWAQERGMDKLKGHYEGEQRIEPLVDHAIELGISHVSFWALAIKNWHRSQREIRVLLTLYRENLRKKVDAFHRKNVRVNVIGNLGMFPKDIRTMTREWVKRTENNTTITVNIALSYGGRDEIVRAVKQLVKENVPFAKISEKTISDRLDTAGQPDPDLIVRTGRVVRTSGFFLWQAEYAEWYFTDVLWPDFTVAEFDKALAWYQRQKRNFGT